MAQDGYHPQKLKDATQIFSGAGLTTKNLAAAVYTNKEIYQARVDPGFNASINSLMIDISLTNDLAITGGTAKWQIDYQGAGSFADITGATYNTTGTGLKELELLLDTADLPGTPTAPFDLRLLVTGTASEPHQYDLASDSMIIGLYYTRT